MATGKTAARRLLVLGASGTLGGPLTQRAAALGWDVSSTYFTRPERIRAGMPVLLDVRDRAAVHEVIETVRPDAIIHAAVTERSGPGYDETIRLAGRHVAEAAAARAIRLISLSTDLVFDGSLPCYTEESDPRPAAVNHVYGGAKLDAERDTLALYPAALVVRTSLIYDFDRENAQVAWMLRAIERGEPVRLFTDQMRCPIWAINLADALLELVDRPAAGLLHIVGPELVSRHDLGVALLAALGIDPAQHVIATTAPDHQVKRLYLSVERARSLLQKTRLLTVAEAQQAHVTIPSAL
ncbi:MAG: NAD-dependent epimerase/dehydratase family protein [Chloroflexi bacterium]|nr:MAG: NAD-dependent epimerase/dehydratase family protein [Chloroflexota bacterium]